MTFLLGLWSVSYSSHYAEPAKPFLNRRTLKVLPEEFCSRDVNQTGQFAPLGPGERLRLGVDVLNAGQSNLGTISMIQVILILFYHETNTDLKGLWRL